MTRRFTRQVEHPLGVTELVAIALGGMVGGGIFSILGVSDGMRLTQDALAAEGRSEYLIPMYLWLMSWFFIYCYPIARITIALERRWVVKL